MFISHLGRWLDERLPLTHMMAERRTANDSRRYNSVTTALQRRSRDEIVPPFLYGGQRSRYNYVRSYVVRPRLEALT